MNPFPPPVIDFSDLERASTQLIAYGLEIRPTVVERVRGTADLLDDAQRVAYYATLDASQVRARIEGAQWAVAAFRKAERRERHAQLLKEQAEAKTEANKRTRALQAELEGLRARVQRQAEHLKELQAAAKRAKEPIVPVPSPTRVSGAPDWDYGPAEQPEPKRGEVVTETPFQVEVTARQIEEYVKRHPGGRCSKPDVSAALPHCRAYLADAYRHLHSSKRVRVDGWTLEVWQHPA